MYIVANTGNSEIVISDLNLKIPPHQSRDLNKIKTSIDPELSKDLKSAIRKGLLKVVKHDVSSEIRVETTEKIIEKHVNDGLSAKEIAKIIREEVSNEIKKLQPTNTQSSTQMSELLEKMNILLQKDFSAGSFLPQKNNEEQDDTLDKETLQKIHARVINKLTQQVQTEKINYNEIKIEDKELNDKINELDGLL